MVLPALGIALDGLPVWDGFAEGVHEAEPALAVESDLGLTGGVILAGLPWVARQWASVLAVFQWLTAACSTAILH